MTRLPRLQTRFSRATDAAADLLLGLLRGSWRRRSALLLALLLGFYAGNNATVYVLILVPGGRPFVVVLLVLLLELVVRLRGRLVLERPPLLWSLIDNARIGLVYAVVLEAFKLGT